MVYRLFKFAKIFRLAATIELDESDEFIQDPEVENSYNQFEDESLEPESQSESKILEFKSKSQPEGIPKEFKKFLDNEEYRDLVSDFIQGYLSEDLKKDISDEEFDKMLIDKGWPPYFSKDNKYNMSISDASDTISWQDDRNFNNAAKLVKEYAKENLPEEFKGINFNEYATKAYKLKNLSKDQDKADFSLVNLGYPPYWSAGEAGISGRSLYEMLRHGTFDEESRKWVSKELMDKINLIYNSKVKTY